MAFGSTIESGDGFPNCWDPDMVDISVRIDGMECNMDLDCTSNALLFLDCDGKNVLSVYFNESAVGQSDVLRVQDGASCSLSIRDNEHNVEISVYDDGLKKWNQASPQIIQGQHSKWD